MLSRCLNNTIIHLNNSGNSIIQDDLYLGVAHRFKFSAGCRSKGDNRANSSDGYMVPVVHSNVVRYQFISYLKRTICPGTSGKVTITVDHYIVG